MNPPVPRRNCSPRRQWAVSVALLIFLLVIAGQLPSANAQESLGHDLIWKPALSPDGSKAVIMDGKELRVVEIEVFSADGKNASCAGEEGSVRSLKLPE